MINAAVGVDVWGANASVRYKMERHSGASSALGIVDIVAMHDPTTSDVGPQYTMQRAVDVFHTSARSIYSFPQFLTVVDVPSHQATAMILRDLASSRSAAEWRSAHIVVVLMHDHTGSVGRQQAARKAIVEALEVLGANGITLASGRCVASAAVGPFGGSTRGHSRTDAPATLKTTQNSTEFRQFADAFLSLSCGVPCRGVKVPWCTVWLHSYTDVDTPQRTQAPTEQADSGMSGGFSGTRMLILLLGAVVGVALCNGIRKNFFAARRR